MPSFTSNIKTHLFGKTIETKNVVKTGQLLFSVALAAFGIQHFLFGDFIVGRAPEWPTQVQGQLVWAWFTGLLLIATSLAIHLKINPRLFTLSLGILIFLWALLRHVPILAADLDWGADLTRAGKALTFFGGAFALAGSLPKEDNALTNKFPALNTTDKFILLGRFCLGTFMIICGIEHFIFVEFIQSLIPDWIPAKLFWSYFTGIALIAGGAGLMLRQTAQLAGILSGAMVFTWFIVLHIPRALGVESNENEWIAVVEALAVSGIAFVVAQTTDKDTPIKT